MSYTPAERNYLAGCPSGAVGIAKGLCVTYRNGQFLPLPYVYTRTPPGTPPYWPVGVAAGDSIGSVAMGPGAEVEAVIRPYGAPATFVAGTGLVPVDSADTLAPPALLAPGQWKPLLDSDAVSDPYYPRALLMLLEDVIIAGTNVPVFARALLLGWGSCIETIAAP